VIPAYRDLLALASLMLTYPDDALCEARADVAAGLARLPSSRPARLLSGFAAWWASVDPADLRLDYVDSFDHHRQSALYVTYTEHGDDRTRGQALFELRRLYRDAGFEPTPDELPDFLPIVCQFVALAPSRAGREALAMAAPCVKSVSQVLAGRGSNYQAVLAAIGCIIEKGGRA